MNVIVDGRKMELDVRRARELGVLRPALYHQIGNHYAILDSHGSSELYVLSVVAMHANGNALMVLINLRTGLRNTDAVQVRTSLDLSPEEWKHICGDASPDCVRFVPIGNLNIGEKSA